MMWCPLPLGLPCPGYGSALNLGQGICPIAHQQDPRFSMPHTQKQGLIKPKVSSRNPKSVSCFFNYMLEGLLLALGRKEMSFHAILTFSPGPKRKECVNPDGGCSCQHSPLQYRQELWGVSATYSMTF